MKIESESKTSTRENSGVRRELSVDEGTGCGRRGSLWGMRRGIARARTCQLGRNQIHHGVTKKIQKLRISLCLGLSGGELKVVDLSRRGTCITRHCYIPDRMLAS